MAKKEAQATSDAEDDDEEEQTAKKKNDEEEEEEEIFDEDDLEDVRKPYYLNIFFYISLLLFSTLVYTAF